MELMQTKAGDPPTFHTPHFIKISLSFPLNSTCPLSPFFFVFLNPCINLCIVEVEKTYYTLKNLIKKGLVIWIMGLFRDLAVSFK